MSNEVRNSPVVISPNKSNTFSSSADFLAFEFSQPDQMSETANPTGSACGK